MLKNNDIETIVLGMGCFWGAERFLNNLKGVITTETGYAGGDDLQANYNKVLQLEKEITHTNCAEINHSEVVKVTFNPEEISLTELLIHFWQKHNPTQGNRQGNDIGSNYRSVIYTNNDNQIAIANQTKKTYQAALDLAGFPLITTEISILRNYIPAEEFHQAYLQKNPNGYCGLGGTGVIYPVDFLLVFYTQENCSQCKLFELDIANNWQAPISLVKNSKQEELKKELKYKLTSFPTIILFKGQQEIDRFSGYDGRAKTFWQWLGKHILTREQSIIAFQKGTERAGTGQHLFEKNEGDFNDPISGELLFKSSYKYDSGSGWPSFFDAHEGALTFHTDITHGMERVEIRSASSGIHLGHVFEDGPAPTKKRFCVNGNVLTFSRKKV